MAVGTNIDDMPVIKELKDFDSKSGVLLERMVFNYRLYVVIICAIITICFAFQAITKLVLNASFEKMIPQSHPYIKNYFKNKSELPGLGNTIRVVVENTEGDIYDPQYLDVLRQINDELFLSPGVDRAWVKSIWMPVVRWTEVTEEGFMGGPVMPDSYDGSASAIEKLRQNVSKAGIIGRLVANNLKSSMVVAPVLDADPATGERLDYRKFSKNLEENIRNKFESEANGKIRIHIIGFAKVVGDLIDGLMKVMTFFAFAAVIATAMIFLYTRCIRSTFLVITCSIIAVIWQLGAITTLGFELDPYSILVPFLVFAIGVSHGAQKMNGIMQDVGRGTHKLIAARYTFRRLFMAGLTALLADAVGFAVLMSIDIPVIRDLALTASIGVAVLIFTNLLLLPVLLSFTGVSQSAANRSIKMESKGEVGLFGAVLKLLDRFTTKSWSIGAIATALVFAIVGFSISTNLKIGDLDQGAPELRPNSRYNIDNAYITSNYGLSSDQFAVMVKTPPEGILKYNNLSNIDRLVWALQQMPEVQTVINLPDAVRQVTAGTYEGSAKWFTISRNQQVLNLSAHQAGANNRDLFNADLTVMPVIAYLADHKAETLTRLVKVASDFVEKYSEPECEILLAAGNAGIEAATNIVVKQSTRTMMLYVYAAVILLCFITFRSWRAVIVAVIPLLITSILCEALMVILGIGVKVATLPVIALGVGIGVDYALYLLSVQIAYQRTGLSLSVAYGRAVQFTGKVVGLVGVTLAGAVITWIWSPIKFQADMGILLTFMFLWNMIGALILIPALSNVFLKEIYTKNNQEEVAVHAFVKGDKRSKLAEYVKHAKNLVMTTSKKYIK